MVPVRKTTRSLRRTTGRKCKSKNFAPKEVYFQCANINGKLYKLFDDIGTGTTLRKQQRKSNSKKLRNNFGTAKPRRNGRPKKNMEISMEVDSNDLVCTPQVQPCERTDNKCPIEMDEGEDLMEQEELIPKKNFTIHSIRLAKPAFKLEDVKLEVTSRREQGQNRRSGLDTTRPRRSLKRKSSVIRHTDTEALDVSEMPKEPKRRRYSLETKDGNQVNTNPRKVSQTKGLCQRCKNKKIPAATFFECVDINGKLFKLGDIMENINLSVDLRKKQKVQRQNRRQDVLGAARSRRVAKA
ncbi:uncharacterized protein LOC108112794 isoform X2 [Drosophila eugracilis]|nr:uncharacterized protein LOC108112794 isoform X2 [Drosophila eugracilis]